MTSGSRFPRRVTSEAEREPRCSSNKHMDTMSLDRLIGLWQEHYQTISEPGKFSCLSAKFAFWPLLTRRVVDARLELRLCELVNEA